VLASVEPTSARGTPATNAARGRCTALSETTSRPKIAAVSQTARTRTFRS